MYPIDIKSKPPMISHKDYSKEAINFEVNEYVLSQIRRKLHPFFIRPRVNFKILDSNISQSLRHSRNSYTENIRNARRSEIVECRKYEVKWEKNDKKTVKTENQDEKDYNMGVNFYKFKNQNSQLEIKIDAIRNRVKQLTEKQKVKPNQLINFEPKQSEESIFQLTNIDICPQTKSSENRRKSILPLFSKTLKMNNKKQDDKMFPKKSSKYLKAKQTHHTLLKRSRQILRSINNLKLNIDEKSRKKYPKKDQQVCIQKKIDEIDGQFRDGLVEEMYRTNRIEFRKKIHIKRSKQSFCL